MIWRTAISSSQKFRMWWACLDRFVGMFTLIILDEKEQKFSASRERFGIEIFRKHSKQHLSFGHTFMRSWQGLQTHWTLATIPYKSITLSAFAQYGMRFEPELKAHDQSGVL